MVLRNLLTSFDFGKTENDDYFDEFLSVCKTLTLLSKLYTTLVLRWKETWLFFHY